MGKQFIDWIKISDKWPKEGHFVIVYSNANAWLPAVDYAYWKQQSNERIWFESYEDEENAYPLCSHGQEVYAWTELPDPSKVCL